MCPIGLWLNPTSFRLDGYRCVWYILFNFHIILSSNDEACRQSKQPGACIMLFIHNSLSYEFSFCWVFSFPSDKISPLLSDI